MSSDTSSSSCNALFIFIEDSPSLVSAFIVFCTLVFMFLGTVVSVSSSFSTSIMSCRSFSCAILVAFYFFHDFCLDLACFFFCFFFLFFYCLDS